MPHKTLIHHLPQLPPNWRFLESVWEGEKITSLKPIQLENVAEILPYFPFAKVEDLPWNYTNYLMGKIPVSSCTLGVGIFSQWAKRVIDALLEIPFGTTTTYLNLAVKLGNPKAARAVARICANNKIALLIPCHRVTPSGKSQIHPGGYRWGLERKKTILVWEASFLGQPNILRT